MSHTDPLTVETGEAARLTGLSAWTVRQLVHDGTLSARRFGRKILIEYTSLREFIDRLEEAGSVNNTKASGENSPDQTP